MNPRLEGSARDCPEAFKDTLLTIPRSYANRQEPGKPAPNFYKGLQDWNTKQGLNQDIKRATSTEIRASEVGIPGA